MLDLRTASIKVAGEEDKQIYNDIVSHLENAYKELQAANEGWTTLENHDSDYTDYLAGEMQFKAPFSEIVDKIGIYAMKLKSKDLN